ncbi:hypothetical protein [Streptomyces sp. AVP053U2]|uniref:hypothetical protein n=1 Tax=Streptomyces sp. AVP053U2 TaxID=1737066 RepID=UPI00073BD8C6|nr:hypothetical protein [Streptomyces sp. AVP053U2]ODA69506.1 hypothetical protein APS67_006310 [Streptomyces sp. AVP053U2]
MAESSWPSPEHNARAVTDVEHEILAERWSDNGVYGTPTDTAVVSAGTGLSVNIRPGVEASVRGHAWQSGESTVTVALSGNIAPWTRIDWVVLRLDRSDWTVRAAIRSGTPGSGAPSLVQDTGDTGTYEIPLARATIQSGASSVTVTRAELYVGARTRPCTSTTRNPHPVPGETCFETNTGRLMVWTGASWKAVYDESGVININAPTVAWENQVDCVIEARNGSAHLRLGSMRRAAGPLAADIESRLPVIIPSEYRHATRDQYGLAYCTGVEIARYIVYSRASSRAGQVWLVNKPRIETNDVVLPASGLSWVVD